MTEKKDTLRPGGRGKLLAGRLLLIGSGVLLAALAVFWVIRVYRSPDSVEIAAPALTETPSASPAPQPTPTPAPTPTPTLEPASMPVGYDRGGQALPCVTPNADLARDLSGGGVDFHSGEKHIDMPDVWEGTAVYSAGSGGLKMPVLTRLYTQDLATGGETLLAETTLYNGSYYETLISRDWIVYVETDHGLNNAIYAMNRETKAVSQIKSCPAGRPRLRLWEHILVWMEPAETGDKLYMIDLETQENIALTTFSADSPYALSAPWVQNGIVTWAGETEAGESALFWLNLEEAAVTGEIAPHVYVPGTYVHEPMADGSYFVWLDTNKSYLNRLCCADVRGNARVIAENVTTYSMGEGFVAYGCAQEVWIYIFATGETCRLTAEGETGIMPRARGLSVVWDTTRTQGNKDVFRCLTLTGAQLFPATTPGPTVTPLPESPSPTLTPSPTGD